MAERPISGIDLSWVSDAYIAANGWFPVPEEVFSDLPESFRIAGTPYGHIPCKVSSEFQEGDVIILGRKGKGYDVFIVTDDFVERCRMGSIDVNIEAVVRSPR